METIKKKEMCAKGIMGIFELFDQFFSTHIHRISSGDITDYKTYVQNLNGHMTKARQYSRIGKSLSDEISQLLSKSDELINNVSKIQEGFNEARQGLKGASSLSEEAVTGIQAASDSIQESIDGLKKDLQILGSSLDDSAANQATLEKAKLKVENIGDVSFNIVMELQFQDILRQRLSAVADILAKTRETIAKGLENIAGITVALPEGEDGFAVTDVSILTGAGTSQDDIDALFNAAKNKGQEPGQQ